MDKPKTFSAEWIRMIGDHIYGVGLELASQNGPTMVWSCSPDPDCGTDRTYWTSITDGAFTVSEGVWDTPVGRCIVEPIKNQNEEKGMNFRIGDLLEFKEEHVSTVTPWGIAEFDQYDGGVAIVRKGMRELTRMLAKVVKEVKRPNGGTSMLLKCTEVRMGVNSRSDFTGLASTDFLDYFLEEKNIVIVAPGKPPASTPDDPHAGMVYNPITDSWSWGF